MRLLKIWGLALIAVFAISAVAAATASAELELPVFHIIKEPKVATKAVGKLANEAVATLSTELFLGVEATGIELSLEIKDLVSLGPYTVEFTGVEFEAKECWTAGDANEVVLVNGEYHLRILNKALELGIEFLLPAGGVQLLCGNKLKVELKIPITGSTLAKIDLDNKGEPATLKSAEKISSFFLLLKCTKPRNGIQELKTYINDKDAEVKAKLATEVITGSAEPACEEVKEKWLLTAGKELETLF